jgi:hypothetical protein
MSRASNVNFVMGIVRDDREIEVDIAGRYHPGSPGSRYGRNGDPGDPPEPAELEITSAKSKDGVEYELDDAEYERAMEKAYEILNEYDGPDYDEDDRFDDYEASNAYADRVYSDPDY